MTVRRPIVRVGGKDAQLPSGDAIPLSAVDSAVGTGDSRLSDAREWTADTVGQTEAETGTATIRRAWTAQRVFQAIAAWWNGSAAKTKLDGIEAGAQVNTVTSVASKTGAVSLVKGDVGLGNVDNTADASKSVASAATLTTARTFTIGATGRSFNGGANVSWTLADIGAAAASHGHSLSEISDAGNLAALSTNASTSNYLRGDGTWVTPPNTTYSLITEAAIATGTETTARTISAARLKYAFDNLTAANAAVAATCSGNAATVTNGVYTTGSYADPAWITSINYSKLTGTVPTWNQSTTGNAATATKLATARTLTIGSTGKSFDGSANVSWTLSDIGAQAALSTVTQAEAEAGTATTGRIWTAERVKQAIAALGGGGGGGGSGCQIFTASGTFTVPAGVTKVKATVVGGGGAGGLGSSGTVSTGGGGGAGVAIGVFTVTPESGITVTVGAGGDNANGGTSSFGAHCSATGGVKPANNSGTGGAGGTASGGDINLSGGRGSDATYPYYWNGSSWVSYRRAGSGGGAGGQSGARPIINFTGVTSGAYRQEDVVGPGGAGLLGGSGADGGDMAASSGVDATGFGNGGSGCDRTGGTRYGGKGSPGIVIVEW